MKFINVNTLEYPTIYDDSTIPLETLRRAGYAPLIDSIEPVPGEYQKVVAGTPEPLGNGQWIKKWDIVNFTQAEISATRAEEDYKNMIRRKAAELEGGTTEQKYEALILLKGIGD
ncbi:MAG: hypothetical protein PHW03_05285 [Eubacteriales bacterium]|nr:hypothetical protein [Eubacteriales bacterium]